MGGIVYDTGALLAAGKRDRKLWALHDEALASGELILVSVAVLAQAWRGGPQAELSRLLRGCKIQPLLEDAAREAGKVCAESGSRDIVDAIVVVTAKRLGGHTMIVTSDPHDIGGIASAINARIDIHRV